MCTEKGEMVADLTQEDSNCFREDVQGSWLTPSGCFRE